MVGGPSTVMVRRHLLQTMGGFDGSMSVLADWDLWLRLVDAGTAALCEDLLVWLAP